MGTQETGEDRAWVCHNAAGQCTRGPVLVEIDSSPARPHQDNTTLAKVAQLAHPC
jgi:hypothetical protein